MNRLGGKDISVAITDYGVQDWSDLVSKDLHSIHSDTDYLSITKIFSTTTSAAKQDTLYTMI